MPRVAVINCGGFSCRNKPHGNAALPLLPSSGSSPYKEATDLPLSESRLRRTVTLSTFPGPTRRKQYINQPQYASVPKGLYQSF